MIYVLLCIGIYIMALRNVRAIGGFERGVDYMASAIFTFIMMILVMTICVWGIIKFSPTHEVRNSTPIVKLNLSDENNEGQEDLPDSYVTIANEREDREYNFIYVNEKYGNLELAREKVKDVRIREIEPNRNEPPAFVHRYEAIEYKGIMAPIMKYGFFVDNHWKIREYKFLIVPLKGVRRGYRLEVDDILTIRDKNRDR